VKRSTSRGSCHGQQPVVPLGPAGSFLVIAPPRRSWILLIIPQIPCACLETLTGAFVVIAPPRRSWILLIIPQIPCACLETLTGAFVVIAPPRRSWRPLRPVSKGLSSRRRRRWGRQATGRGRYAVPARMPATRSWEDAVSTPYSIAAAVRRRGREARRGSDRHEQQ
jgi:hypothetical protein